MLTLFGALVWEFEVTIPPFAGEVFDGGPGTYGLLTSAIGAGAIVGALLAARRDHRRTGTSSSARSPAQSA
jgi:hypothetical protein